MMNPRVIVLVLLTGIALLFLANVPDTTPAPNVTTYSSSAWDFHNPIPHRVMPANPDTVPDSTTDESDASSDPERNGDDNGDGRIDEDESGWDCKSMGNNTCGDTRYVQAEDGSYVPESFYGE